jgi:hypothetical protein
VRKWLLILGLVAAGLLLVAGVGVFALYHAARHVPDFYQQALSQNPQAAELASDAMLEQTAALTSDIRRGGHWQAVFTADQINGWLAVDLERNHPDLLPSSLSAPRVAIRPDRMWLAFRLDRNDFKSVVSLAADVYLAEPNVVALRIRQARAGLIPLPLDAFLEKIAEKASDLDLDIQWRQAEGDPVVEITVPAPRDEDDQAVRIESLQLGEGKLTVSGSTEPE